MGRVSKPKGNLLLGLIFGGAALILGIYLVRVFRSAPSGPLPAPDALEDGAPGPAWPPGAAPRLAPSSPGVPSSSGK